MTGEISSSVLSKATFEGTLNSNTTFSGNAGQITAKAWLMFGGDTPAIIDDYNISSIADTATGNTLVNFENNMSNANYCVVASYGGNHNVYSVESRLGTTQSTSQFNIWSIYGTSGSEGMAEVVKTGVLVFGD
jgi:hypothetical protein